MGKVFWITDSRFKFIAVLLMIIFFSFMALFYLKADEISKDPCSICAERIGEDILCTTGGIRPITRTYGENGSIYTDYSNVQNTAFNSKNFNLSE